MDRLVRIAMEADLPAILTVVEAARGIMRASGNVHQWENGYPSADVILSDIYAGYGYVVMDSGKVVGYFAFIPSPEPSYATIFDGAWLDSTLPYHVVHRIASIPESHGIFRTVMDWCFSRDSNIRIDTHADNHIMQHCILSYGFHYCGIIHLLSGSPRLAYQLMRSY